MSIKSKFGFTLIELLVVIAIIGMLTSVVLASLNIAKAKGSNGAVKDNMHNIRSQAQIVYENNNGSYKTPTDVCNDGATGNITRQLVASSQAGAGNNTSYICNSTATAWAASVPLRVSEGTNNYWCVDNVGDSKGEVNGLVSGGATVCP